MYLLIDFDVWYGGRFVVNPKPAYPSIVYIGGTKHEFKKVDFDRFHFTELYSLCKLCGGNRVNVRFYYRIPGIVIEHGLVCISGDREVSDMYAKYKDSDLVTIWIEETTPLPKMVLDPQGNSISPQEFFISEPVGYLAKCQETPLVDTDPDKIEHGFPNLVNFEQAENEVKSAHVDHNSPNNNIEHDSPILSEFEPNHPLSAENDLLHAENTSAHVGPQVSGNFHESAPEFDPLSTENASHEPQPSSGPFGGDIEEMISDFSEFDDSSDENYVVASENSESGNDSSEVPSEFLEDLDWSDDEDIFAESVSVGWEATRKKKLGKNNKGKKKVGEKRKRKVDESGVDVDWYSDDGEEDELLSLEGSDDEGPKHPTYKEGQNMKNFKLIVGMKFKSAQEFREVLRDNIVREGYEFSLLKNERTRITGVCKNGCDWRIHASLVMGGPTFQIKSIKGSHTCARTHVNKFANYKYLAMRIEKIVRDNPDIKIDQLKNIILRKCAVDVSYWKVVRAKKAAVQKIRGVDSVQYLFLRDYCETVLKFNPGSKIIIRRKEDFEPPTFDKMYFCLQAMKGSFLSGCRPIIVLDGCFLKTVHGGQLLVAVGRDGNDNMVPIALAVVRVENRENWTWFLRELLEDIGGLGEDIWTFISDRQKGLIEALKELVPNSQLRYCLRHMYQNFKKKHRGIELKDLFWKAGTTANKNEFDVYMKKISEIDPKLNATYETACEWLQNIPPVHWARSHFPTDCLSDVVVNNLCESFNSYILDARDKPIITMLECIRNKLMKRIQKKKVGMDRYIGEICPNIMRRINKNQKFSRNFFAIYSGENEYQIQCLSIQGVLSQYVVDLNKKTCTCGMFQLCGYPCAHACTAIGDNRQKLEDYVHIYYNKSEYLRIYSHMIHAVPGQADYCKTQCEPLNAPVYKTKKGRPQRMRRREADEGGSSLSTRKGLTHTCSKCLELGHNIATCKNQIHPKSKLYKGAVEQGNEIPETRTSRAPKQAPKRPSRQVPNTNPHQSSAGPSMTNSKQAKSFPQASSRANTQSSAMESTSASVIARARGIATGEDSSKATATAAIRGSTQGRSASSGSSAHIGEKNSSSSVSASR